MKQDINQEGNSVIIQLKLSIIKHFALEMNYFNFELLYLYSFMLLDTSFYMTIHNTHNNKSIVTYFSVSYTVYVSIFSGTKTIIWTCFWRSDKYYLFKIMKHTYTYYVLYTYNILHLHLINYRKYSQYIISTYLQTEV